MISTVARHVRTFLLATIAVVTLAAAGGTLYAYGQEVGRDQVVEALDAGAQVDAVAVAFDPAAPEKAAPTAVEVPSATNPGGVLEVAKDARKTGGLWLAIVIVVGAVAAAWRKHSAPGPDDDPNPTGWRARTFAIAEAVAAVSATLVDIGFGAIGWSALVLPVAYAAGRVRDAFNPPKVGKAKE